MNFENDSREREDISESLVWLHIKYEYEYDLLTSDSMIRCDLIDIANILALRPVQS